MLEAHLVAVVGQLVAQAFSLWAVAKVALIIAIIGVVLYFIEHHVPMNAFLKGLMYLVIVVGGLLWLYSLLPA